MKEESRNLLRSPPQLECPEHGSQSIHGNANSDIGREVEGRERDVVIESAFIHSFLSWCFQVNEGTSEKTHEERRFDNYSPSKSSSLAHNVPCNPLVRDVPGQLRGCIEEQQHQIGYGQVQLQQQKCCLQSTSETENNGKKANNIWKTLAFEQCFLEVLRRITRRRRMSTFDGMPTTRTTSRKRSCKYVR